MPPLRIAIWNLERATDRVATLQQEVLARIDADVAVLTEVLLSLSCARDDMVASPAERTGRRGKESWAAIVGDHIDLVDAYPFERLAAAARTRLDDTDIVVYGSVLPWLAAPRHAPRLALPGETSFEMFDRVLHEQAADVRALQERFRDALVLWVGDFNETLDGRYCGSRARRVALEAVLDQLGLCAWNRTAAHAHARVVGARCDQTLPLVLLWSLRTCGNGKRSVGASRTSVAVADTCSERVRDQGGMLWLHDDGSRSHRLPRRSWFRGARHGPQPVCRCRPTTRWPPLMSRRPRRRLPTRRPRRPR